MEEEEESLHLGSHRRKVLLGWILPIISSSPPPPQMVCVSSHPWKEGRGAFAGGRKTRFNGPGGFTKVDCVRMYVLSMYVGVHRRPSRQPSRQSVRTDVRTHVYKVKPSNPPVGVQKATR